MSAWGIDPHESPQLLGIMRIYVSCNWIVFGSEGVLEMFFSTHAHTYCPLCLLECRAATHTRVPSFKKIKPTLGWLVFNEHCFTLTETCSAPQHIFYDVFLLFCTQQGWVLKIHLRFSHRAGGTMLSQWQLRFKWLIGTLPRLYRPSNGLSLRLSVVVFLLMWF